MFWEMIGLLLIFAVILLLCYYTTRLIGKRFSGRVRNKNMKIVETLSLGLDRCLYLIYVGNKYFLFFSGKKGLEFVSEIELEQQTEEASQEENNAADSFDFKRIFETYSGLGNRVLKKEDAAGGSDYGSNKKTGIPGSIERLKKINNKNN